MSQSAVITEKVSDYYWKKDVNCATTILSILAEMYHIPLHNQLLQAATGMHGAGGFGAQCGLVEGGLMFLGIIGREQGLSSESIENLCQAYAGEFEKEFSSLSCRILRPEGFHPDNPPHLCEPLTCRAAAFALTYTSRHFPLP